MRLRTINETIVDEANEGFDTNQIDLGILSDYKNREKIGDHDDFDFYKVKDLHPTILVTEKGGDAIIAEVSFSPKEKHGIPVHTAQVDTEHRGKGLYLQILKIAQATFGIIASYPFDPDSDQERSESANKFWIKNGKIVGKMDGEPIYQLK